MPLGTSVRTRLVFVADIVSNLTPQEATDTTEFALLSSAELEMTVALLVQIDKLVMLIESPVFTCKSADLRAHATKLTVEIRVLSSPIATARTREVSLLVQVSLWTSHAVAPE
jgi:hypothetical protein